MESEMASDQPYVLCISKDKKYPGKKGEDSVCAVVEISKEKDKEDGYGSILKIDVDVENPRQLQESLSEYEAQFPEECADPSKKPQRQKCPYVLNKMEK